MRSIGSSLRFGAWGPATPSAPRTTKRPALVGPEAADTGRCDEAQPRNCSNSRSNSRLGLAPTMVLTTSPPT